MLIDQWPLAGLRLTTPRLELRVPGEDDLSALAELADRGIHDPAALPFATPWTQGSPEEVARRVVQWHWGTRARWSPDEWELQLVTVADGEVVGTQSVGAKDFRLLREVGTGSWLGRAHQGRGFGTEMRAAVLDLAFAGLGAEFATSEAFDHNRASAAVSRRLGYTDDGINRIVVDGVVQLGRRFRLDKAGWAGARSVPVKVFGLDPCLPMLGLDESA